MFGVHTGDLRVALAVSRQVVGLVRKVANAFSGSAGTTQNSLDTTCDRLSGLSVTQSIVKGVVIRSGIGSYDCEVSVADGVTVVCSMLVGAVHSAYGVSQATMPVPGSCVLVYLPIGGLMRRNSMRGIILGVIPEGDAFGASEDGSEQIKKLADTEFPEGGVSQFTETGPADIASDRESGRHGEFQCGRPRDIVPGEYGLLNHVGSGLMIGAASATLKGSEMASVRVSALDDQVRVTSGHYWHISAAGSHEIYNDSGFLTVESGVSLYQTERLGVKQYGEAFKWESVDPLEVRETVSGVSQLKPTQTAKRRLYRYEGYLGDVVNVFVANPDPSKDIEEMATDSKDQGLLHYHVDSSGRFVMRSAGGILFERFDRIPIPKRRHFAWDPAGDKDGGIPEPKDAFRLDKNHPMGIGLALADLAAWWDHQSYARFRQFGKDFTISPKKSLGCPDDEYDAIGKGAENFKDNDLHHAYFGLLPNGGLVFRDAWGSEIVMADGRITFNAAANIEVRSGSSVVILGGDDVIVKAYNSADISATKKDVRIKAENNLQAVSMNGGIILQSKAKGAETEWTKQGEDAKGGGVIIKAETDVVVGSKSVNVNGSAQVSITSFSKKGKPQGDVVLAGQQVIAAGKQVMATSGAATGVILNEQSIMALAPSVQALGGRSALQAAGNKLMLGIPITTPENLYAQTIKYCKTISGKYLEQVDWLNPITPKVFSEINFTYRTTKQYGTDKDSGLSGQEFKVYEPAWAVMAEAGRPVMKGCATRSWDEGKDEMDERPWPGKEAFESNGYVITKEQNITSDGNETDKPKGESVLTGTAFSRYHIRQQKQGKE